MDQTILYLIRHGATEYNLARPYRLQGRIDTPLSEVGIQQAELTAAVLANQSIQHVYTSPLQRAVQTAEVIAHSHHLPIQMLDELMECDVGEWEGLSLQQIEERDGLAYQQFQQNPAKHGYPRGETFADVAERAIPAIDQLFETYRGETIVVIGHHVVNRVYLAALLGMPPAQARKIQLANCGISTVMREETKATIVSLNSTYHLKKLRAA